MSMTICPKCSSGVSSQAKFCQDCGHPLAGSARKLKALIVVGALFLIAGIVLTFHEARASQENGALSPLLWPAVGLMAIGAALAVTGRLAKWWKYD